MTIVPRLGRLCRALALWLLCMPGLAAQVETERCLSSCDDPLQFTCARTPLQPEFQFRAFELEAFAGARVQGQSLRWHVRSSSPTQTTARIGFTQQIAGPVDAIALHVKNPNAHDLGLRLEVTDADGVVYVSPTVELVGATGWRKFVFALNELRPANGMRDAWPGVDLPLIWLQIAIGPLEVGRPYTIYLDELQALAGPRPRLRTAELAAPPSLGPGERIPVTVSVTAESPVPEGTPVFFELQREGATLARAQARLQELAAGQTVTLRAEGLSVPPWVPPGRYQIALSSPASELTGARVEPASLVIGGPTVSPPAASLEFDHEQATLRWAEAKLPPVIAQVHGADASVAEAAPRIIAIPATTDSHPFGWVQDASPAEGVLDFTGLDRIAAGLLNHAPEALLLVQVFLDSPPWWDAANADQLVRFHGQITAPLGMWGRRRTFPDLASGRWAGGARDRLRALVEHVEASPYAHRVIGYELLAGDLGAWRPWGAELDLGDENTPLRLAAWRNYLVDKYRSFAALRDAWGLPPAVSPGLAESGSPGPQSWENVVIPQRQPNLTYPALYDPASNGAWIDLNNFAAEMPARLIARMAATVDEIVGGRKLIGVCYGHAFSQSAGPWRWPHLALDEVLGDESIDMLTGPLVPAAGELPFPTASATAAGKLWLERQSPMPAANGHIELRPPPPGPDMSAGGLAVIFDDVSARYLRRDGGLVWPLFGGQLRELGQVKVPWRLYTMGGLLAGQVPPAPAYLFLDAFKVDYQQRVQLVSDLCQERRLLIWVYAPAAIDKYMISGRTMMNLTGIKLSFVTTPGPLRVQVPPNSPLLDSHLATGLSYGADQCFPRFFSADDRADRMGMLEGTAFVGLSVREYENCVSVHSAAPGIPAEVLRGLLRRIGLND